jgi:hypothetical protein
MHVRVRNDRGSLAKVGDYPSYGEALCAALTTLRWLEAKPITHALAVEIHTGCGKLRFCAQASNRVFRPGGSL